MQYDYRNIKNNMRRIRSEKSISQEVLAEKASLDRTYISKIENGDKNASVETLVTIAYALGVTVNDLLSDDSSATLRAESILSDCSQEETHILLKNMENLKGLLKIHLNTN